MKNGITVRKVLYKSFHSVYHTCYFFLIIFLLSSCCVDVQCQELTVDNNHYLIVFGDIQQYTKFEIDYYKSSISWIIGQIDKGDDICAVLEVGDVTNDNWESQWGVFRDCTKDLACLVPFYVCTGNHDYDWDFSKIRDRSSSLINQYAHFRESDKHIVEYYQESSLENYIAQIKLGNNYFYLLVLEFGPRPEVLTWATDFVREHKNERFILMTHEWLDSNGERMEIGTHAEIHFKGCSPYSTPEDVWNLLVNNNDNIVCVLSGHEKAFSCVHLSENVFGRKVPQILFNLQFLPNGGDGIIQIWKFSDNSDSFFVYAYDAINGQYYKSDSSTFCVPFLYDIHYL